MLNENKNCIIAVDTEIESIDCRKIFDYTHWQICSLVSLPLFKICTDSNQLIPFAAEKLIRSEDGMSMVVEVKDNLHWSDGSKVTAFDYERAFTSICLDPTLSVAFLFRDLIGYLEVRNGRESAFCNGITVISENNIKFEFNWPNYWFEYHLSHPSLSPQHIKAQMATCGPYEIYGANTDSRNLIQLKRASNYFLLPITDAEFIKFVHVNDVSDELSMFANGLVDKVCDTSFKYPEVLNVYKDDIEIKSDRQIIIYVRFRNTASFTWSNEPLLRRRINRSISRSLLASKIDYIYEPYTSYPLEKCDRFSKGIRFDQLIEKNSGLFDSLCDRDVSTIGVHSSLNRKIKLDFWNYDPNEEIAVELASQLRLAGFDISTSQIDYSCAGTSDGELSLELSVCHDNSLTGEIDILSRVSMGAVDHDTRKIFARKELEVKSARTETDRLLATHNYYLELIEHDAVVPLLIVPKLQLKRT